MKKYILDTSVLVRDPQSFKTFENSEVILPVAVLEELDKLKKFPGEAGKAARVAIRLLDDISNSGDITTGVLVGTTKLIIDAKMYPNEFGDTLYGDTRILSCAFHTKENNPEDEIIFVSNDINLRVRAKSLAMKAESYEKNKMKLDEIYTGIKVIQDPLAGSDLITQDVIDPKSYELELHPNEYVLFTDENGDDIALGRLTNDGVVEYVERNFPWGLAARNTEQKAAIDLILDPDVPLITLIGQAGTGKSLITLAAALELVLDRRLYEKFIIYRPIQAVGNDIGYLPGTMEEKLAPWFQAIMDNFEVLFTMSNGDKWRANFDAVRKKDRIQMEAITYIRGRSIPNAVILIDEAQNLSKEEIKTILTRAGENTKIILTGDVEQIDNSALDAMNNGLTYVIERFKDSHLAGHITFTKGERSELATEAAKVL